MIIIEGPDGSGKTTLAMQMAKRANLEYRHMGPPEEGMDHVQWYLDRVGPYVWDRFHLGEETYGACGFSRRGTWLERELVRKRLQELGAFVIVLYASRFEDLRCHANKQLYTEQQQRAVNERYREIACDPAKRKWVSVAYDVSYRFADATLTEAWLEQYRSAR